MSPKCICRVCNGSGKILAMNSWFPKDGYRRLRCAYCAGTGFSKFRLPEYEKVQAQFRNAITAAQVSP